MSKLSLEGTAFGLARKAGVAEWTEHGPMASWYPDLELSHVLHALTKSRTTYTDRLKGVRLRRHPLIQAPHGWSKTSAVGNFLERAIGVKPFDDPTAPSNAMRVFTMKGRSNSIERLRGSVTAHGDILEPVFAEADYIVLPELKSALGLGTNDRNIKTDMADNFLEVLEEDEGSVNLIKITGADIDADRNEELEGKGIFVNRAKGTMRYRIISTVIGCSTFFAPEQQKLLTESGFLDRFFPSRWMPSSTVALSMIHDHQRVPDVVTLKELLEFNTRLNIFAVDEVDSPPWDMVKEVLAVGRRRAQETVSDGFAGHAVVTGRDQTVAYQLLTAAAFERTVREWNRPGYVIQNLLYDERDIEIAAWFYDKYNAARILDVVSSVQPKPMEEKDLVLLASIFTALGKDNNITHDELRDAAKKSRATYFRWRGRCIANDYLVENEMDNRTKENTFRAGITFLKWREQQAGKNWGVKL